MRRSPLAKVREISVEQDFVNWVEEMGGETFKVRVAGKRGFVDRLVILPGGRVVFAEVKRPIGGRVSPHQAEHIRRLRALGCEVLVVNKKRRPYVQCS